MAPFEDETITHLMFVSLLLFQNDSWNLVFTFFYRACLRPFVFHSGTGPLFKSRFGCSPLLPFYKYFH